LYAISTIATKVSAGLLRIVSDSKINVDMYYQPRAIALASANSDLWRLLYHQLDTKSLVLKLFWVPGHLDTKPLKIPRHVPDVFFALNHAADYLADKAAAKAEVPLHLASGVLHHSRLVRQIQNRLSRVLITTFKKTSYEKPCVPPRTKPLLIAEVILASNHNIQQLGSELRCLDCSGSTSVTAANVRQWLASPCEPLPYDDNVAPVPIPAWFLINVGNTLPHSSHELFSVKGIIFCNVCGAFAKTKCRLLNSQCAKKCTVSTKRALTKLRACELPAPTMCWPRQPGCIMRPPPSFYEDSSASPSSSTSAGGSATVSFFDNPDADIWEEE
jgi:hypothetical protein